MAGILPRRHTSPWSCSAVQCSAAQCLVACQLTIFLCLCQQQVSEIRCLGEAVRPDLPSLGVFLGCSAGAIPFLQPVRLSLLSVWRESMFRVLVDTRRQPMGSALHYSLMGGACVSDDEMCLRKRSARAGWDLSTAVRPEPEPEPESLGPFSRPATAAHCTVTHQIPTSDPGPETSQ